jgi:hypothetical protein
MPTSDVNGPNLHTWSFEAQQRLTSPRNPEHWRQDIPDEPHGNAWNSELSAAMRRCCLRISRASILISAVSKSRWFLHVEVFGSRFKSSFMEILNSKFVVFPGSWLFHRLGSARVYFGSKISVFRSYHRGLWTRSRPCRFGTLWSSNEISALHTRKIFVNTYLMQAGSAITGKVFARKKGFV